MPAYSQTFVSLNTGRPYKTKRCSCSVARNCSYHDYKNQGAGGTSLQRSSTSFSSYSSCDSKEYKVLLSSAVNSQPVLLRETGNPKAEPSFKSWLAKKNSMRLEKQKEASLKLKEGKEKRKLLKCHKEDFDTWLSNKQKEEDDKRALKELAVEEKKLKQIEKEMRQIENELSYQQWLSNKRKVLSGKKTQEEALANTLAEEKRLREAESQKAFEHWLDGKKQSMQSRSLSERSKSQRSSVSIVSKGTPRFCYKSSDFKSKTCFHGFGVMT